MNEQNERHVVLIGAGHAHLHVAQQARRFVERGVRLTLVDPGAFWYSGLATGMLGGQYPCDDDTIDPAALIERHGGTFIKGRAVAVDRAERLVHLEDGRELTYEIASFNIGSEVPTPMQGAEHAWTVKPIEGLCRLRRRIEDRWRDHPRAKPRVVVGGGGPTGCEIAANLIGLARRRGTQIDVTLVAGGDRLVRRHPSRAARALERDLTRRGVHLELGRRVRRIEPARAHLDDGRSLPADVTILAVGLKPPRLFADLGLTTGEDGGLRVDACLRSADDPRLLAAGDCIDFEGHRLPKLGVFGVRQAPVLLHNLLATLDGRPLQPYTPQKRWLSILNLGDGRGLAIRGSLWWMGRASMWLKDYLDRSFLEGYR